jgi:hypothetical protein
MSLAPTAKVIIDGLERVSAKEASKSTEIRALLMKALLATRGEVGRLLAALGVKEYACGGKKVLSVTAGRLRIPPDHCCVCKQPPLENPVGELLQAPKAQASKLPEVHAFLRRAYGVGLPEARQVARASGVESKKSEGTRAAFKDGHFVRVPPNACVVCGRAPSTPAGV